MCPTFFFEPKTFPILVASISCTVATTTHAFLIVDSALHDTEVDNKKSSLKN
jgi:hypothetical protein